MHSHWPRLQLSPGRWRMQPCWLSAAIVAVVTGAGNAVATVTAAAEVVKVAVDLSLALAASNRPSLAASNGAKVNDGPLRQCSSDLANNRSLHNGSLALNAGSRSHALSIEGKTFQT